MFFKDKKTKEAEAKRQARINNQWHAFLKTEAGRDFIAYLDNTREMLIKYGEDRAMPHPVKSDDWVNLDNDTVAGFLQSTRTLNMIKTYVTQRAKAKGSVSTHK